MKDTMGIIGTDIQFNMEEENWLLITVKFIGKPTMLGMIRDVFGAYGGDLEPNEVLLELKYYNEVDGYERLQELSKETGMKIAELEDYLEDEKTKEKNKMN